MNIAPIFISDSNEDLSKAIIIDGDQHSVWAYILEIDGENQNLIFDGFICSRGTIVKDGAEVKKYISQDFQPPLMKKYKNEYSVQESLSDEHFTIEWDTSKLEVKVKLKNELYLIMNILKKESYSKATSMTGPYGIMIEEYEMNN